MIRDAGPADAAMLAGLGRRTFVEAFAAVNTPEDMSAYCDAAFTTAHLAAELADRAARFLVAESSGEAVGYAKLYEGEAPKVVAGPGPIELARLYVVDAAIGRGVGSGLMRACLSRAVAGGFETMWLGVWEHNARALAFYRRFGFREVGSHPFRLGEDVQTDLLVELSPLEGQDRGPTAE